MSEEKSNPRFDEQTLDKLLEAAYVLQEHNQAQQRLERNLENQRSRIEAGTSTLAPSEVSTEPRADGKAAAPADYTVTLGKIVETQRQIQVRQLDLQSSMSLIAERVVEISSGNGAAIGLVDGVAMHYQAIAGQGAPRAGSTIATQKALSHSCIETAQVVRCEDIHVAGEGTVEEVWKRGVLSAIAVPVFVHGDVAGALELYYGQARALTEQDVHTCQLMAGLVTEALVSKSLAAERAAMLDALEKLQPNLAALADKAAAKAETTARVNEPAAYSTCDQCGHQLPSEEQFCGECGAPRTVEGTPVKAAPDVAVPKVPATSAKELELAAIDALEMGSTGELETVSAAASVSKDITEHDARTIEPDTNELLFSEEEIPDFAELLQAVEEAEAAEKSPKTEAEEPPTPEEEPSTESKAVQKLTRPADWSSAASAKDFLERLVPAQHSGMFAQFWSARRGDIYLGISVILVICVIVWGTMSSHSVGASGATTPTAGAHKKAPDGDLSAWDRMLIQLGLAEAPQPPEDKGNPATQVWVDQRTALYYCPGADLYGKTAKGKFTSQREAQLDQFEPAYRKPCN